jgi:predicted dienelactone hydrolase
VSAGHAKLLLQRYPNEQQACPPVRVGVTVSTPDEISSAMRPLGGCNLNRGSRVQRSTMDFTARHIASSVFVAVLFLSSLRAEHRGQALYDPLAARNSQFDTLDLVVHDAKRKRDIPLLVYTPGAGRAPVVLFSHGLGGSREMGKYLGEHWARRGYAAIFLQHPGSDAALWQGKPRGRGLQALAGAASPENFIARIQDVRAVLDWLERSQESEHGLRGRLDLARVGMSGHSFGAITTQAVSGQRFSLGAFSPDPRIKAALPMSPSPPQRGDTATAFRSVRIPWLVMTGTLDSSPIGNTSAVARREVFAALPPSFKYELLLDGAEHSAFTDRALPGDRAPRNPNHHRVILAISTAFWDAYLRQDVAARAWLDGSGPRSVMQPRDGWQRK